MPSSGPGCARFTRDVVAPAAVVPEPGTVALLAGGLVATGVLGGARRRRRP